MKSFDYQAEVRELRAAESDHRFWRRFSSFTLGAFVCNLIVLLFLPRAVWVLPVVSSAFAGSLLMSSLQANEVRRVKASLERFRARIRGDVDEFSVLDYIAHQAPIFEDVLQARGVGRFVRQLEGVGFIRRRGAWIDITPAGRRHVIQVHEREAVA